jgi:hypothetical protein
MAIHVELNHEFHCCESNVKVVTKLRHEDMSESNECFKTRTHFHKCVKANPKSQVDFSN